MARQGREVARGEGALVPWRVRLREPELRHLGLSLRSTACRRGRKLTSPALAASFDARLSWENAVQSSHRLRSGMVGHNWGGEHAERWIWLHGLDFEKAPGA